MHLHEYQAKQLFGQHGIPVPQGRMVESTADAAAAAKAATFTGHCGVLHDLPPPCKTRGRTAGLGPAPDGSTSGRLMTPPRTRRQLLWRFGSVLFGLYAVAIAGFGHKCLGLGRVEGVAFIILVIFVAVFIGIIRN